MSDPVAPVPAQPYGQPPAPAYGQPVAPPKKKRTGKILLIILGILVVVCGGLAVGGYFLLGKAVDVAYSEGNCIDVMPTGGAAAQAIPQPVSCTDSRAAAKILKVADDKPQDQAEAFCKDVPGATGFTVLLLKNNGTKTLCLGPK
jgi:hypothetical protein